MNMKRIVIVFKEFVEIFYYIYNKGLLYNDLKINKVIIYCGE